MKEVKHYICEICGTEYNDKEKAQKCEKGHKTGFKIIGTRFLPITNDATGLPCSIVVEFQNGIRETYKR